MTDETEKLIEALRETASNRKRAYDPLPETPTWEDIRLFYKAANALSTEHRLREEAEARLAAIKARVGDRDVVGRIIDADSTADVLRRAALSKADALRAYVLGEG